MGGIVEVVLSVGAITGAAMFLPPLWSLFSKSQTGRSVLTVTIMSLLLNLFLKFISPSFLNIALSRSMEMIVGVGIPILLLIYYEIKLRMAATENLVYEKYKMLGSVSLSETREEGIQTQENNRHGRKVIAFGILFIGILIILIGVKTIQSGWIILIAGVLVLILGIVMNPGKRSYRQVANNKI